MNNDNPASEHLQTPTRIGKRRTDKFSPAWQKADDVVSLYRQGQGHKTIAKALSISPRIAREILIELGAWAPRLASSGRKGQGEYARDRLRAQAWRNSVNRIVSKMKRRAAKCIDKKAKHPTHGMSEAERFRWRYHNEPKFRLHQLIRSRMKKIMQGAHISQRQLSLLGCSMEQFKQHIESHFTKGMTWDNNGVGRGKWNIDHASPCRGMDTENELHMRALWHWRNLRPVWSLANIKKRDRINHRNAQLMLWI